jgi:hypothetical protein
MALTVDFLTLSLTCLITHTSSVTCNSRSRKSKESYDIVALAIRATNSLEPSAGRPVCVQEIRIGQDQENVENSNCQEGNSSRPS